MQRYAQYDDINMMILYLLSLVINNGANRLETYLNIGTVTLILTYL